MKRPNGWRSIWTKKDKVYGGRQKSDQDTEFAVYHFMALLFWDSSYQ